MRALERGVLHVQLLDLALLRHKKYVSVRLSLGHHAQTSFHAKSAPARSRSQARSSSSSTAASSGQKRSQSAASDTPRRRLPSQDAAPASLVAVAAADQLVEDPEQIAQDSPLPPPSPAHNPADTNATLSNDDTVLAVTENSADDDVYKLNTDIDIPLTYHAYLFDTLKLEVLNGRPSMLSFGDARIGRAKLRLAKLPAATQVHTKQTLHLLDAKDRVVGSVSFLVAFSWAAQPLFSDEIDAIPDLPLSSPTTSSMTMDSFLSSGLPTPPEESRSLTSNGSSHKRGPHQVTLPRCMSMISISSSSAPVSEDANGSSYLRRGSSGYFGSASDDSALSSADTSRQFVDLHSPTASSWSAASTNVSANTSLANTSVASTATGSSVKFVRYTKLNAMKEVLNICRSFFGEGWRGGKHGSTRLSTSQVISSVLLIKKWYKDRGTFLPMDPPHTLLPSVSHLKDLQRVLRYCLASYGWMGLNFFGYGGGYLLDAIRRGSDRRCVLQFLKAQDADLLVWEMDHSGVWAKSASVKRDIRKGAAAEAKLQEQDAEAEMQFVGDKALTETGSVCRPYYYVIKNKAHDEICLCIRGTLNVSDTLTDIACQYEPFLGGFVHGGILLGARRLYAAIKPALRTIVAQHQPQTLLVAGHSMGAATAQVLAMMIKHYDAGELGRLAERGDFRVRCVAFAPPPVFTEDLASRHRDFEAVVNHTDIVPRLSYGAAMDMKELIVTASHLLETDPKLSKSSGTDALTHAFAELDRQAAHLSAESPNLKLVCAGTVTYLAPSRSATTLYDPDPVTGKLKTLPWHANKAQRHLEAWRVEPALLASAPETGHLRTKTMLLHIPVASGALMNHTPDAYDRAMARTVYWAKENARAEKKAAAKQQEIAA
ncbi:hypothetical protein RI367_006448 [Sorochytrium milnesiophthora]